MGEVMHDPEIVTALDIALNDEGVHQIGHCLLHTAVFQDIGLVW